MARTSNALPITPAVIRALISVLSGQRVASQQSSIAIVRERRAQDCAKELTMASTLKDCVAAGAKIAETAEGTTKHCYGCELANREEQCSEGNYGHSASRCIR